MFTGTVPVCIYCMALKIWNGFFKTKILWEKIEILTFTSDPYGEFPDLDSDPYVEFPDPDLDLYGEFPDPDLDPYGKFPDPGSGTV